MSAQVKLLSLRNSCIGLPNGCLNQPQGYLSLQCAFQNHPPSFKYGTPLGIPNTTIICWGRSQISRQSCCLWMWQTNSHIRGLQWLLIVSYFLKWELQLYDKIQLHVIESKIEIVEKDPLKRKVSSKMLQDLVRRSKGAIFQYRMDRSVEGIIQQILEWKKGNYNEDKNVEEEPRRREPIF